MAELLLVSNPHRRKRRKNPGRRRSRRSNPGHRRRRRTNPHRYHRRRRTNPHFRRRRRTNPSMGGVMGRALPVIKDSLVGAAGGLANDALYNIVSPYLSGFLGSIGGAGGFVQYGVKMATALGVGYLARYAKLPSRDLAVGAATCATHDFLKTQLMTMAPSLFGSGAPLALSGYSGLGAYLSGSAPLVGTATFPATYLPYQQNVQMGAYLSGSSGMADGSGVYSDDCMGQDYWSNH
jgi:hypothetical protein